MSRSFKVGIIGGGIGRQHIEGYRALGGRYEVAAICDLNLDLARGLAAEFAIPRATDKLAELLAADIDVVDVCTPPGSHRRLIEAALDAGRHVVCEKPLVGSLADADAVIARAARGPQLVMPIFQYRFASGYQKLLRLIERGVAGPLHVATVETHWRRGADYYAVPWRGKWESELGGALLGHAIHAHDMLCGAAGPIAEVFAFAATRVNPIETEDCAAASLRLRSGALASLSVSLGAAEDMSRLRFCFRDLTAESAQAPYNPGTEPWRFVPMTPEIGTRIDAALADFTPEPERFAGQFLRLHRTLADGAALPVTLADARASLELVTALYHAAATSQVVSLPIGPGHPRYASWRPVGAGKGV
ncbi:MAG: Gfo/Idh/MocA family oxidoreductase [Alphaproteobacteria bacterium]|nr:Gfo/Idh/MocA family oxidoreductase [Alphaproteobacteria bacterium]